jgi:hypothetical protein
MTGDDVKTGKIGFQKKSFNLQLLKHRITMNLLNCKLLFLNNVHTH